MCIFSTYNNKLFLKKFYEKNEKIKKFLRNLYIFNKFKRFNNFIRKLNRQFLKLFS